MPRSLKWMLGLLSAALVVALCLWHILLVGKPLTFFDYFVLDMAFLPVQVLLVSVIVEGLLSDREKKKMMKKLNMVIGAFFSEVGYDLVREIAPSCEDSGALARQFDIAPGWGDREYRRAIAFSQGHDYRIRPSAEQLEKLRRVLSDTMPFMLNLLQNPNLLEHDRFTELLWAVTHFAEELRARGDIAALPESDLAHLRGDMARFYRLLIREWLGYLRHLKAQYPYIYSLAIRTSPFREKPDPVITAA